MSLLQFKTVTLCDKSWVDPIVMAENSPSADYNFGNIYIWDKFYKQLICRFEDDHQAPLRRGTRLRLPHRLRTAAPRHRGAQGFL